MTRNVENTETLARDAWQDALEDFTKIHQGDGATIEVVDRQLGDQEEVTERLPLAYIEYDVVDREGTQTVVVLHARPALRGE